MPLTLLLRTFLVAVVALAVTGAATATASSSPAARHALVRDSLGLYTAAQAARGEAVHKAVCAECHEMQDFTNEDFKLNWNGSTLFELYESIRTTMPDENPGTLTQQQYTDVVTYLLRLNELPEGDKEFVADSATASAVVLRLPTKAAH